MGLAIAYSVALSIPLVGAWLACSIWGGEFPGGDAFVSRLYIVHVLILPVVIATLLALHLRSSCVSTTRSSAARGRTERNVVGTPLWPGYALRSVGLLLAVAARARSCSAAWCRSTRSGSGGRTSRSWRPTARSRTGTWAG